MRFLSVCSGIEAASCAWHPLEWKAVAFSEIEPFPSAVLAQRWPDVPNLGDMTKFADWPDFPNLDIVCGGTPCQSFSVAGLRKGLLDPRGNLTLTFLAIVNRYRPKFVLWENVPGVLSDKTGGMDAMLDGFEELGYVIDVDILDAQFHGVPQRRRRVFICAQSVETLLSEKTPSSVLTMAQCLSEILHGLLIAFRSQSESGPANSVSPNLSKDGVRRRMKLFGLHKAENLEMLRASLADAIQRSAREQTLSGSGGDHETGSSETMDGPLQDSPRTLTEKLCESWSIGTLWQHIRDALLRAEKWSTTSTATTAITPLEIFTFSQAALNIGRLIALSSEQSPCFWSAASSNLTAVQAYIDYARHTSSDLFGDTQRICAWHDFIRQAEPTNDALGDTGIRNFGAVLPLSHSLQGHSAPSRQAGKGATHDISPCIGASGRGFERTGDTRGQDAVVAVSPTLRAAQQTVGAICADAHPGGYSGQDAYTGRLIAHSLRGEGFDASEDGTGRCTPLVPVAFQGRGSNIGLGQDVTGTIGSNCDRASGGAPCIAYRTNAAGQVSAQGDIAAAVTTMTDPTSQFIHGPAVAFQTRIARNGRGQPSEIVPALNGSDAGETSDMRPCVATSSAVRRLTPRECERLQGFPDDHTLITYRGKPAADGPRYKALGNSMAAPCMSWIGERIAMVDALPRIDA